MGSIIRLLAQRIPSALRRPPGIHIVLAAAGATVLLLGGSADALAPTIDLNPSSANFVSPDFEVVGWETNDAIGRRMAVGDFNGDGRDDLLLGVPRGDGPTNSRIDAGEAYVILGSPALSGVKDLAASAPNLIIYGADAADIFGSDVDAADVNGDLIDDILIGAPDADGPGNLRANGGEAYVFFGSGSLSGTRDVCQTGCAGGSQGAGPNVTIYGGEAGDALGRKVGGGRTNGDAIAEIIVAAPAADGPGTGTLCGAGQTGDRCGGGEVYVFFGAAPLAGNRDVCQTGCAGGSQGAAPAVTIFGEDGLGADLAVGDVNGDGRGDIAIGADNEEGPGANNERKLAGKAYVVFGAAPLTGNRDVCQTGCGGGSQGAAPEVTVYGAEAGDNLGSRLAIGQVNGSGPADLLVVAKAADGPGSGTTCVGGGGGGGTPTTGDRCDAGEAYVIFGSVGLSGAVDICQAPIACGGGVQGPGPNVTIYSATAVDEMSSIATGDVNADGTGDILFASDDADGPSDARLDAGEAYVINGSGALSATYDMALGQHNVIVYAAEPLDDLGAGLVSGDLNGDGFDDLIIGAPAADGTGAGACGAGQTGDRCTAGEVYVFLNAGGGGGTDSDGDGVPDGSDNCPWWPNPTQTMPPWQVPANDPDCDGFADSEEAFVGTDPHDACASTTTANDETDDRWPADINDDMTSDILDIVQWTPPAFNSSPPDPNYSTRKDFNGNGTIDILDIVRLTPPTFGKTCT